jgi:aspartyl-tRNA(Asn)/glutamyl-tRNA(Gln) amidotransferase subunit A
MSVELAFAPITELAEGLRNGAISATQLVELYARRIEKLSDSSRAFISLDLEHACEQAAVIDATADNDTPLSGIPYACKDLFDVHGVATTGGSRVLDDNVAQQDAEAVARMNRAGAIFLGKNNLHEFAYGATGENEIYGTPPNPYDATRLAGGSSSGSAAALGYGLCAAALGTDTGGSVRAPAALCGLVGFKPTFGRISTEGVIPYSWSLDHVGTLTRSAADAAILFETLAADNRKAEFTSLDKLTIGVPDAFFFERCEGEILDGLERLMAFLRAAGAKRPVLSQPLPRAARQFIQPGFSCRAGAGPVPARRAVYSRQTFRRKLPPRYEPPVRGRRHDTHAGNAGDSATHRRGRGRG